MFGYGRPTKPHPKPINTSSSPYSCWERGKRVIQRKKNIWALSWSSLFNDIGSEMITPILPFFIIGAGGAGLAIGLVSGLREGLASIFKFLGGWASDAKGKRKIFVVMGYFLSVFFRFLLGIAGSWQQIVTLVSAERIGKSRDAPRDVIISKSTHHAGKSFGINQMMDTTGGIIGAILVLLLFVNLNIPINKLIMMAATISLLSLAPLLFVKDKKSRPYKRNIIQGIEKINSRTKYFIFVTAVFTLANFGLYMFILLLVKQYSGSLSVAILFYIMFNISYALFSIYFGKLSDRDGRKHVLLIGYALFVIVSTAFIFTTSLGVVALLFILYGIVYAITQPIQKAYIADNTKRHKGTAFGFYYLITGVVNVIGGLLAGIFWDISPQSMFGYISVVALISFVLLIFVKEDR